MTMSMRIVKILDHTPGFVAQWARSGARHTRLLRPLINVALPDREVLIRVRSGVGAELRIPILARSEKYYWTGVHERHLQETLADLLRPGMTFWDVGAHIGFFSLLASRLVTRSGQVEAFEPFPPNQIRLARSIRVNDASNVNVHPLALSSHSGTASFHVNASSLMGSLMPQSGDNPVSVDCLSVDDAIRSIRPPQVMKIDAEGAELDVLRGARRLLANERPKVLIELTTNDMLAEIRTLAPTYRSTRIGANHWLLAPL